MAGVGFELKKLFRKNDGYVNLFKSYTISAIVIEGPMFLCILMMMVLREMLVWQNTTIALQESFLIIITYTMTFSMIISNSFMMFQSRYISDCIYSKEVDKIIPSFYGISCILLILGAILSGALVSITPLTPIIKLISMTQFQLVTLSWVLINYLSCIKLYKDVVQGFLVAAVSSITLGYIFLSVGIEPLLSVLLSWTIGYALLVISFLNVLFKYFPQGNGNIFAFVGALDKYKTLLYIGFFMVFGLYGHNFVLWASQYHTPVLDVLRYCMLYDIPSFYAVLSISPMVIMFTVSLEVNFYEQYRNYFQTILQGGRYEDIQNARNEMARVLYRELAYMFEMQLLVAILCATLLGNVLEYVGLDYSSLGIFRVLCFGYAFYGLMRCSIIVQLYFDDRRGALWTTAFFAISSVFVTAVNLYIPIEYMGFGFAISAAVSATLGLMRLYWYIKNIAYQIFCKQPIFVENEKGFFTRISQKLGGM